MLRVVRSTYIRAMSTCIIVDDNPLARAAIRQIISEQCDHLHLVGEADSVVSGAKLLRATKPDILFLDIELGDGQGFDLLDIVPDTGVHVIFTTGSDEYALRAFGYAAVDYLMKPIRAEDLQQAVQRTTKGPGLTTGQKEVLEDTRQSSATQKIALHTSEEIRIVEVDAVVRLEASGNYTTFFFSDGSKLLVSRTLKDYARILGEELFIRTHQSHLINLDYVQAYMKTEGGYILMKDDSTIPVSVRKKSAVMDRLSL